MSNAKKIVGQLKLQFISDMQNHVKIPDQCPRCKQTRYKRNGYTKKGSVRYRCLNCGKSFIETSDLANDLSRKSIETWDLFVDCMLRCCSHRYAAYICNISPTTSMQWRHQLFDSLEKLYLKDLIKIDGLEDLDEEELDLIDPDDIKDISENNLRSDAEIGEDLYLMQNANGSKDDSAKRVDVDGWSKVYIKNVYKYRLWQKFVKIAMETGYEKEFIGHRILKSK